MGNENEYEIEPSYGDGRRMDHAAIVSMCGILEKAGYSVKSIGFDGEALIVRCYRHRATEGGGLRGKLERSFALRRGRLGRV